MNKRIAKAILVAACGLALPGCITHEETVYRDVERAKVEFENDTAARVFYEALSKAPASRRRVESRTEVNIPVVFEHRRRVVMGDNAAFNEAVSACDTNRDGRITEPEARIFAARREKR
ncbi:MAG: hypothetical protein ACYDH9_21705 [Limisphaerales bacterium]